jgi:hypothetical protein
MRDGPSGGENQAADQDCNSLIVLHSVVKWPRFILWTSRPLLDQFSDLAESESPRFPWTAETDSSSEVAKESPRETTTGIYLRARYIAS